MVSYVRSALDTREVAAALFDLRDLEYTWGDAIGGVVWALRQEGMDFLPSAIVANGRTALALKSLFDMRGIFSVAGTKLFRTMNEPLRYLEGALRDGGG
jgi:hypothetical protein